MADNQALIITANNRIKQALQNNLLSVDSKVCVSEQPGSKVYVLNEWVQTLWQQLSEFGKPYGAAGQVLNDKQELFLWRNIIESDESVFLATIHNTSTKAFEAAQLLELYQAEASQYNDDQDHQLFLTWLVKFNHICARKKFITQRNQVKILINAYEAKQLQPVENALLLGFMSVPPLYQKLIGLAATNTKIPKITERCPTPHQILCHEYKNEIEAAGFWAKEQLEKHKKQRFCILISDLQQRRTEVNRILNSILNSKQQLTGAAPSNNVFNISAAQPLSESCIIHDALMALKLNKKSFKLEVGVTLLNSPFFSSNINDEEAVLQVQSKLYAECKPAISIGDIEMALQPCSNKTTNNYLISLRAFSELLQQHLHGKLLLSSWVGIFSKQLKALGWPGKRPLNSAEFQQLNRWFLALTEFEILDQLYGQMSLTKALELLNAWVSNIAFQVKSQDCPVQVLGTLECLNLNFDAIWITGFNDNKWPATVNTNPFIPVALQRKLSMPHADPETELTYAKLLLANYQSITNKLITSYSGFDGEQPLRPSKLLDAAVIRTMPAYTEDMTIKAWNNFKYDCVNMQIISDESYLPIKSMNGNYLLGGATMLKNQSQCPFRSFAIHRLNIKNRPKPEWHISELQRGQILHQSMQLLWQQLENHHNLITYDKHKITSIIDGAINIAIADFTKQHSELTTELFVEFETNRLHKQLRAWLELEANRQPFNVLGVELEQVISIDDNLFKIRIDRLDEHIESGDLILIDYKTGDCSMSSWHGKRPSDLQLPLYCVGLNIAANKSTLPQVRALSFAKINAKEQKFLGLSSSPNIATGINTPDKIRNWSLALEWGEIEQQWLDVIRKLIHEFKTGVVSVDPVAGGCRNCYLQPLCRINDHRVNVI